MSDAPGWARVWDALQPAPWPSRPVAMCRLDDGRFPQRYAQDALKRAGDGVMPPAAVAVLRRLAGGEGPR